MIIAVDPLREAFFDDVLKNTFAMVIPAGTPASMIRTIRGLEGHNLKGAGHEVHALLLLDCLTGIPLDIPGDSLEDLVLKALVDCKNKSNGNKAGFLASLTHFCDEYVRRTPTAYHCMFFLQSSNVPDWVTEGSILGYKMRRAPRTAWRSIADRLSSYCSQMHIEEEDLAKLQAVEILVRAKRPQEAIQTADRVSRILRGAYFSRNRSWHFAGRPAHGSNPFKASPFYFVRNGRNHIQWAYVPGVQISYPSVELPEQPFPATSLYLNALRRAPRPGSAKEILAQALGLFAVASDVALAHEEFLALWQTLEILSLVKDGSTKDVAAKIGNYFRDGNHTIRPQLMALAPFRNSLVHRGEYNSERQSAVFLVGLIVRNTLMQFAQLCEILPLVSDLSKLQSLMTAGPSTLRGGAKAVKAAKLIRDLP